MASLTNRYFSTELGGTENRINFPLRRDNILTHRRIIFPRLHAHDCLPKIFEVFESPSHRRIYGGHAFLTRNTSAAPHLEKTPNRCLDGVNARIVCWNSYRPCNVCANPDARPAISEQRSLATARPSGTMSLLVRVGRPPKHVRRGFEGQESDGDISFDKGNRSSIPQEANKGGIFLSWPPNPG